MVKFSKISIGQKLKFKVDKRSELVVRYIHQFEL